MRQVGEPARHPAERKDVEQPVIVRSNDDRRRSQLFRDLRKRLGDIRGAPDHRRDAQPGLVPQSLGLRRGPFRVAPQALIRLVPRRARDPVVGPERVSRPEALRRRPQGDDDRLRGLGRDARRSRRRVATWRARRRRAGRVSPRSPYTPGTAGPSPAVGQRARGQLDVTCGSGHVWTVHAPGRPRRRPRGRADRVGVGVGS